MLDAIVSFSVANVSPHGIGKTVGTVLQAKQHANVKGSQIEPSEDLKSNTNAIDSLSSLLHCLALRCSTTSSEEAIEATLSYLGLKVNR